MEQASVLAKAIIDATTLFDLVSTHRSMGGMLIGLGMILIPLLAVYDYPNWLPSPPDQEQVNPQLVKRARR